MSVTAPWAPQAQDAVSRDLFHTFAAEAVPLDGDPIALAAEAATVTLDDAWAPHVRAVVTCPVPEDQATLDALDPRRGVRLRMRAGYRYPGGRDDTHDLALLELRSRPVRRPKNTLTLNASSAECRLQDRTPLGTSRNYTAGQAITTVIADLIGWQLGATVDVTATSRATLGQALTVTTGADLWDTAHDLADRAEAWLYVDALGVWHLAPWPTTVARSAHIMSTGPGGNLTDTEAVLDVGEWGNAVLLDYGSDARGWAQATTGPFAVGEVPLKVVTIKRTADPGSQWGRNTAAATVLRRVLSRGRGFTLSGPAAYWLRPGHTVTVRLPSGPQERHLVSRVEFDLTAGEMTVRTRVPDDDTTITTGA